jgi:hypothetical protein
MWICIRRSFGMRLGSWGEGQWAVGSGQWTVGSGQRLVVNDQRCQLLLGHWM